MAVVTVTESCLGLDANGSKRLTAKSRRSGLLNVVRSSITLLDGRDLLLQAIHKLTVYNTCVPTDLLWINFLNSIFGVGASRSYSLSFFICH